MTDLPKAYSIGDILEEANDQHACLEKEIIIDDGNVVFKIANDYCIELNRLNSSSKLIAWIYHLVGKPWMTPSRLKFFIRLVCAQCRINIETSL